MVRERGDQLEPLFWPWGKQLLLWSKNGDHPVLKQSSVSPYWARAIHVDGYLAVAALSRGGMRPEVFAKIHMPVFAGYYYRDEQHQDSTVSVAAMLSMFEQLGTPSAQRELVNFPQADAHVIASPLRSKSVPEVFEASCCFLQSKAKLPLVPDVADCADAWRHTNTGKVSH